MGVYPFMFGSVKDFEPVVNKIIQVRVKPKTVWRQETATK